MFRNKVRPGNSAPALILLLASGMFTGCGSRTVADDSPAAAPSANPAIGAASGAAASSEALDGTKFHALLVGCTKYDNLNSLKWLNGPANDVDLVRHFFTDHLRLPAQSIVVLSEPEAAAHGETSRPTRANIEREIKNLIDTAKEGDQVVLILAGHGGQQPEREQPDITYLKPDGRDQMFLPCDCGQWSGKKWCVERAIVDYELRNWCKQITAKKARLFVVLDACCSGWNMRNLSQDVKRDVSTEELGIPQAALDKSQNVAEARNPANHGAASTRGSGFDVPAFNFGPQSPDYVGLYAAQRDESELEMPMPYGAEPGQPQRVQGLLTYAIIDVLSHTSRQITYGELANLVRQRYPQWGETKFPTPVVEGLAQDRVVLGVQRWPGRSRRQWEKKVSGQLTANEGSVQGLTPNSILALYPPIDQPNHETVLGYAKVGDCDLLGSSIQLTEYGNSPVASADTLPNGGCFEVARTDYGSLRIKLGVDIQPVHVDSSLATSAANDATAAATLQKLAADLKTALSTEGSLCEFADDARSAQWLIQMRDGKLTLISKDAAQIRGQLPPDAPRFSISDAHAVTDIVNEMTGIARAQNLLNLTKSDQGIAGDDGPDVAASDDPSQPNVELKLLRYTSKSDHQGTEIDPAKGPLTLVPGNYVRWRMTNQGQSDVAVCLLYIDAGFGIHAIFPRSGGGTEGILTKNGGHQATKAYKITADPVGNEHVVLIAVPRQEGHQTPDFTFLEQQTLPKARGGGDDNPGLDSPLGRLLKNAMYGEGGTRGMDSTDAAEAHLMLQSWRVSENPSP